MDWKSHQAGHSGGSTLRLLICPPRAGLELLLFGVGDVPPVQALLISDLGLPSSAVK